MISALLLAIYAVTAGTLGAGWLREAHWPRLAPRMAIVAWQALAASVLLALAAAGLALAISFPHVRSDLARLLHLCAENLQHGYASPGGTMTAVAGVALFLGLLARVSWCAVRAVILDRRDRNSRVAILDLVGRTDVLPGALVLDHQAPYAFCVGGRRHRVVVTSGLLANLNADEVDAVLAHEHAHLRQRHHVALVACRALFGALAPTFPAFCRAMPQVRLFAELSADDSARRRVGARPLRQALTTLACLPAPAGALAASAHDVQTRLLRLDGQHRQLTRRGSALAAAGIGAVILVPLGLASAPALALAWEGICLLG
ncbi:M56 family metallopeptidase [Nocardioides taihuensis]|uniref:M56 family metallopeptidase n=1 Tax=Nocardioides taihuensis TaxID=1835606 RepID=A0ABW0BDN9_9ACTN